MAVNISQLSGVKTSNKIHLAFTALDPIYGFVGTYSRISQVLLYQEILDIYSNRKTESVPFHLYFEFEVFYIPLSLIFVRKKIIFIKF